MGKILTDRDDINTAAARLPHTMGVKKEIRGLVSHLWDGETVKILASGSYDRSIGLIVLTDQRLLYIREGALSQRVEDFPLSRISSIQWSSGMVTGKIVVHVSGTKAEIEQVDKAVGKELVDTARSVTAGMNQPQPVVAAVAAGAGSDAGSDRESIIGSIRQLGELRELGVLNEDEFEAKKSQLLAQL